MELIENNTKRLELQKLSLKNFFHKNSVSAEKIDFYRKTKNKKADDEDIRHFLYQNNKINDYEIQLSINKIKKELDENQQKLLKMSFFEQKSHKKIAEELEIPLGTVKSRSRSTLNKMQKFLS